MSGVLPPWEALHYLPAETESLLDVGCNTGDALIHAHELGVRRLAGVEINQAAVETARRRLAGISDCVVFHGSTDRLPLADGSMDVILCCEVLEHVPRELRPATIAEAARVLKPGGVLILTVPFDGAFALLDPANVRFRWPRLHGLVSRWVGGRGRDAGFELQKHGVVWHHHFGMDELRGLLEPAFSIRTLRWRASGLLPLCEWLMFPFYRKGGLDSFAARWIRRIGRLDLSVQSGPKFAYNLLLVAKRAG